MAASIRLTPVPSAVTSGAPGSYTRGEEFQLDWEVRNTAGTLTAPSSLTFTVRAPDGVDTEYTMGGDAEVTNNADGTGSLVLTLDQSARWFFRCVTGTPTTAAETDAMVERSALEDAVVPTPGAPGVAYDGALARAASGVYSPYLSTEAGEHLEGVAAGSGFSWQKRRGWVTFDGDTTGLVSCVTAINAASAALRPGQCLFIPDGKYLVDGRITTQANTTLVGTERDHRLSSFLFDGSTDHGGAMFLVTHTNDVAFRFGYASAIGDIEVLYPNQNFNAAPAVYPATFHAEANKHGTALFNVLALNPYDLLRVGDLTDPRDANSIRVDNIYAYPLHRGITLGRVADVARITNVHFNPNLHYNFGATLKASVKANASAFVVDGAEEFFFSGCFALGYKYGIEFLDEDGDGFRGSYGTWIGGGLDQMGAACVRVSQPTGLSSRGFDMIGAGLIGSTSSSFVVHGASTHVPGSADERPRIGIVGRAAWNNFSRVAYLESQCHADITIEKLQCNATITNEGMRVDTGSTGTITFDLVGMPSGTQRADDGHGSVKDLRGYWTDYPTAMLADDGSRNMPDPIPTGTTTLNPSADPGGGNWAAMPDNTTEANSTVSVSNGSTETGERFTVFVGKQGHTVTIKDDGGTNTLKVVPVNYRCKVHLVKATNFVLDCIEKLP